MKQDLVSIITPTYNCGKFIEETIRSVQAQTYTEWEMCIVDDCSSDDTDEVIHRMMKEDSRIRYYKLKENSGAAVARTKAMEIADGEYMAFLDSDDLWYPEKLERQLTFMRENDYPFTATKYEQIDEEGNSIGRTIGIPNKVSFNRQLLDGPIGNSTVIYNVAKMGKFIVPNIRKRNDDALWLTMLRTYPYVHGMQETLMKYRIRRGSISHNKFELIKYHWKLYRDILHLSYIRSIFHILVWIIIKILKIK